MMTRMTLMNSCRVNLKKVKYEFISMANGNGKR